MSERKKQLCRDVDLVSACNRKHVFSLNKGKRRIEAIGYWLHLEVACQGEGQAIDDAIKQINQYIITTYYNNIKLL